MDYIINKKEDVTVSLFINKSEDAAKELAKEIDEVLLQDNQE
ncbi:hypothetical protein [Breznakia blatticola]|nr:hypothetical protein [Breznakia blatticola]